MADAIHNETVDFQIRLATEADIDAINDIYNHYVNHSTCTFHLEPVTHKERAEWLSGHSEKHPVLIYESDGKVLGWASLSVHRPRPAYANTVETSIYIDINHLGQGIGKALLAELIRLAKLHGHHTILGGMEASQTASIRLHESFGFTKVAHYQEIGYKFDQWLDTVFYQLMLDGPMEKEPRGGHNIEVSTPFTIRPATRADEPGIQHVIRTVYEEYGWPWDPEDYHKDLYDIQTYYFDHGGQFWVAEMNGKIVGTAALEIFPLFPTGEATVMVDGVVRGAGCDCSVERLYVLAETRGKGAGSALWKTVIEAARACQCRRMEIWSDKRLHEAHRLYEKTGAIRIGERLCHDPDQSPEWGMALDLGM